MFDNILTVRIVQHGNPAMSTPPLSEINCSICTSETSLVNCKSLRRVVALYQAHGGSVLGHLAAFVAFVPSSRHFTVLSSTRLMPSHPVLSAASDALLLHQRHYTDQTLAFVGYDLLLPLSARFCLGINKSGRIGTTQHGRTSKTKANKS